MVSVIIVTWNKEKDVTRLLEQLRHIDYPENKYEITVVDNNSSDNTAQSIESRFPSVHLLRNQENLGGAGGFNTGMQWVLENRPGSKYMWLLDNDVLVERNALKELVNVMESRPDAGICGSRIMNTDDRSEILEIGAFIDYRIGESIRNVPKKNRLRDKDVLFEVDYVSACSLLARTELVRKLGLFNDSLFVYWDDKEWGVRFNASGCMVLASNASVVYHPDWTEGRMADNSKIWRTYYGIRNCLWFFNNYVSGIKRRLLLVKIVVHSMKSALQCCLNARLTLSKAIVGAVEDFFKDSYGGKRFQMPPDDMDTHFRDHRVKGACVFFSDARTSKDVEEFVGDLMGKYSDMTIYSIVPEEVWNTWADLSGKESVLAYRRPREGTISWTDRLRIMHFLWRKPWSLLLTPPRSFTVAGIGSRHVAVVDFEKGTTISIEKVSFLDLVCIPFKTLFFLIRAWIFPPETNMPSHLSIVSKGDCT
ncbi:MAG: glycosyltransferase family 2 protein [Thermodesulfobacteriota bacterium]|nr:glycosyltransferase family 2 protein [Thermodesulfobacteriota bacterium]